jgi:hypothetical protein
MSKAQFINPSHRSGCMYACAPPNVVSQSVGQKRYRDHEYICNNKIIVLRAIFYAVRVLSKESMGLFFPRTYCLSHTLIF